MCDRFPMYGFGFPMYGFRFPMYGFGFPMYVLSTGKKLFRPFSPARAICPSICSVH